jgi:ERCC4-type nuclease
MDRVIRIIKDTREPSSFTFAGLQKVDAVDILKLDFGDYTTEKLKNLVVIERKAKGDLFHTLGSDHERFAKELDRARAVGVKYFFIVIEASLEGVYEGNWVFIKGKGRTMTFPYGSSAVSQLINYSLKDGMRIIPVYADNIGTSRKIIRDILIKAEEMLEKGVLK